MTDDQIREKPLVRSRRLRELERREMQRTVAKSALVLLLAGVVLVTAYYLVPVERFSHGDALVHLIIGVVLVAGVIILQVRRILGSDLPGVRAAEALGIVIAFFLVVFARIYLSAAASSPSMFSQRLDYTTALYFTITVFSTVGFGDIIPRTDPGRIIVSIQMMLDLVIIGLVVRLLIHAAKSKLDGPVEDGS